jgi:serine phosphatase RsbU (regulator of sigma subunit)
MSDVEPAGRAPGLLCGEVRGGTAGIYESFALPGLRGVLYSQPCRGASGGDVHYLSVCGSGLLARVCLADVAGHGDTVAAVSHEMHAHLQRSVDVIDERRVLRRLDRRLEAAGLTTMTTAALATYYPPSRRLTVSYAGHPAGWLYSARERRWMVLQGTTTPPAGALLDLPLGTGLSPSYTRHRFRVSPGDRVLLYTDGVPETVCPDDRPFDTSRIAELLTDESDCERFACRLLSDLHAHARSDRLVHDDVSFLIAEVVEGPPGPAIWHVVKNRLLSRTP